jgi:hypothetical protein
MKVVRYETLTGTSTFKVQFYYIACNAKPATLKLVSPVYELKVKMKIV